MRSEGRPKAGWLQAATGASQAAAFSFLFLLCVGGLLVLSAKLQVPDLGAGARPTSVFTTIAIVAMGCLGAPVRLGGLEITALPLGALLPVGVVLFTAARATQSRSGLAPRLHGVLTTGIFATLCFLSSLVFRLGGDNPLSVAPPQTLLLACVWGFVFTVLPSGRAHPRELLKHPMIRPERGPVARGAATGLTGLAVSLALASVSVVVLVVASFFTGPSTPGFGIADALGLVIEALAFLPNLGVNLVGFSMGAPIDAGVAVGLSGASGGEVPSYSLAEWAGTSPPWYAYSALVLPLVAMLGAGVFARRRSRTSPTFSWSAVAALSFSAPLALLAWISEARLGAGVVTSQGFARLSANVPTTLVLGLLWAAVGIPTGWWIVHRLLPERR